MSNSDQTGADRAKPESVGARPRARQQRRGGQAAGRSAGRRRLFILVGLVAAVLVAVLLGPSLLKLIRPATDFTGEGKKDIIVQVHSGDSGSVIAQTLKDSGVIANVDNFLSAAKGNAQFAAIQPGFYKLRTEISSATAVADLTEPQNRVGKLVIPEGRQLDDIEAVGSGKVTDGIFTLIADASCVELNGERTCLSAQDLKNAAGDGPLSSLNVPEWATVGAGAMGNSHRRLEGLIAPGTWNIDPSAPPQQVLATLVAESNDRYLKGGLLETAQALNLSPYEVLIVASLLQKEAQPGDFAKVARVIYNRLNSDYDRLEFDSTVNYPLARQEVATTDADRHTETPWNTYAKAGLPATPICSPSDEALAAAERPEPGDWLYFVTIDMDGTTLFTSDYQEHLANIEKAQGSGILDSQR
ncbi:MAG: hypothetical protein QG655_726 [Actinomycetota bacterium]|nr:hypothetical protein [Actinomycetota bacterium]